MILENLLSWFYYNTMIFVHYFRYRECNTIFFNSLLKFILYREFSRYRNIIIISVIVNVVVMPIIFLFFIKICIIYKKFKSRL